MPNLKIYHNPNCSKSRETLGLLEDRDLEIEIIEYLETPPTAEELDRLCQGLSKDPTELIRTKEDLFNELNLSLDDDRSQLEWCQLLIQHPILIERPIVVNKDRVSLGRPPEQVLDIL